MSKSLRRWDDIPLDVRNNVLSVIENNHIDFDPVQMTGGVKDTFNFVLDENTNNRLGYRDDIYDSTYRVPDCGNFSVYVNFGVSGNNTIKRLALDFYDREIKRSDYIYMEIDKRR